MKRKRLDERGGDTHDEADGPFGGAGIRVRQVRQSSDPVGQPNDARDERLALAEGWGAFAQLLEAGTPRVDRARLISAVTFRVERRRFERRAERLALAASLLLMAGLAWFVGSGNEGSGLSANGPQAGTAAKARVAAADVRDAVRAEVHDEAVGSASLVAWDDGLDQPFELAWQQAGAMMLDRLESDPFVELRDAMYYFESRLESEAL